MPQVTPGMGALAQRLELRVLPVLVVAQAVEQAVTAVLLERRTVVVQEAVE